jgi:DNA helicase-2/ATP-dependent DNA helicase PcrA
MTRAQERLHLSHALQRILFGRRQQNAPSRFLSEIPEKLLQRLGNTQLAEADDGEVRVDYSYSQLPSAAWGRARPRPQRATVQSLQGLRVGTQVRHDQFGLGTVRALEGQGEGAKALVHFARGGVKKLLLRFAQLEIVTP